MIRSYPKYWVLLKPEKATYLSNMSADCHTSTPRILRTSALSKINVSTLPAPDVRVSPTFAPDFEQFPVPHSPTLHRVRKKIG